MKSNTRKKILALFAITAMSATAAWAAVQSISNAGVGSTTVLTGAPNSYSLSTPEVTLQGIVSLDFTTNYNDNAADENTFVLDDEYVLNIKPGIDTSNAKKFVGGPAAPTITSTGGLGFNPTGGVLRLKGGTTNLYGAGANDPDFSTLNNYDGGTLLAKGRLNIAHSNALGYGPVTLAEDTTLGTIETSNVDLGITAKNNTTLNNTSVFVTSGATGYHQNVVLRRYDSAAARENVRAATIDVIDVAGVAGKLRILTGITQEIGAQPNDNYHPSNKDYASMQLVKTGAGTLEIHQDGVVNFGGTHAKEGLLFVDGGTTSYFVGELGATWNYPWYATLADEGISAKINYDAYVDALGASTWGVGGTPLTRGNRMLSEPANGSTADADYSGVPAYMNTWGNNIMSDDLAQIRGGGYVNPLTIDEGATVKVNRSQFIGDLSGDGTFEIVHWAKNGVEVIPQVTMQVNNTLSTNSGANAKFDGNIVGKVNLVLDNPVQATGSGQNADQATTRINFFPRTQALTGSNSITTGDTFVKDGTLSINKAGNIGPGKLRIGMYEAGYENDDTGVDSGTDNFRGFRDTMNVATFHGLESMTIDQETVVYAPGLYVGGQLAPASNDATVPSDSTRSVTWYGNNPENVSSATAANLIGQEGRYNAVGPYVNLAATRGKTVGFSDITLHAQNGSVPTIAQISGKSDIRYVMTNAMAVNDKMDENPNWDGIVAFSNKWNLAGATSSRMFGFDVKAGTLQMSEVQQSGYALVGVRQGATLRLGNNARDFGENMQVVVEDDARICVKPQTTDLAASLADAQAKDAVFTADSINYTGLGMGDDHKDKRIVVQIDLSNISNTITDQWIKVVGSNNAANWNNIHYYDSSAGQTEHLYKVKVAQPDNMVFDGNYSVTPYADQNQYNIYVHIKKIDQPTTSSNFSFSGASTATNGEISGSITLRDNAGVAVASTDVTFYLFSGTDTSDNTTALESMTVKTDESGVAAYAFTAGGYGNGQTYTVKAVATGYDAGTSTVTTTGAEYSSSSSSGCDAGFGAFALLAMAGGALVLRRKD